MLLVYRVMALEWPDDAVYLKLMADILDAYPMHGPPREPIQLCTHVYIGSQRDADDIDSLKRLGVTHVLNCAGTRRFDRSRSPYPSGSGIDGYLLIPAEDHEHYDIIADIPDAILFLDRVKLRTGKALVHCNLGINRSGAICTAYLMHDRRFRLLEAVRLMKRKRSVVLCNKSFRAQLVRYARARHLLDSNVTVDMQSVVCHSTVSRYHDSLKNCNIRLRDDMKCFKFNEEHKGIDKLLQSERFFRHFAELSGLKSEPEWSNLNHNTLVDREDQNVVGQKSKTNDSSSSLISNVTLDPGNDSFVNNQMTKYFGTSMNGSHLFSKLTNHNTGENMDSLISWHSSGYNSKHYKPIEFYCKKGEDKNQSEISITQQIPDEEKKCPERNNGNRLYTKSDYYTQITTKTNDVTHEMDDEYNNKNCHKVYRRRLTDPKCINK